MFKKKKRKEKKEYNQKVIPWKRGKRGGIEPDRFYSNDMVDTALINNEGA